MRHSRFATLTLAAGTIAGVLLTGSVSADSMAGRYKKQGDKGLWDAGDSGPNQCEPVVKGRFKRSGESCTWAAGETGSDECRPAKGRFKKDGSACAWNDSDTG